MPLHLKLIWLLASGGNILILAGMVKQKAWLTSLYSLWAFQLLWMGCDFTQDLWHLDYWSWTFFDDMGIALYPVMALLLVRERLSEGADWVPIAYIVMTVLKVFQIMVGFEGTRDNLLPVRQFIGIGADWWFAWCLFRGMISPRYTHESRGIRAG